MNVSTLKMGSIQTKADLHLLYNKQMGCSFVRAEINEILKKTRNVPQGMRLQVSRLRPIEVLMFIVENGYPNGWFPDEEMMRKIDDLRRVQTEEKYHLKALERNS